MKFCNRKIGLGATWSSKDHPVFQVMSSILWSTDSLRRGRAGYGTLAKSVQLVSN